MRTTLTLEPDVAERVSLEVERTGRRMKEIVNQALRLGLGMAKASVRPPRFKVQPHSFRFSPDIDLNRMHQLLDDLEAEEVARKLDAAPRILANPLPVAIACGHARSWLAQPQTDLLHPGSRHAEIVFGFLEVVGAGGNLTTDAHLAALAIENQAELYTLDSDFARFSGLRWKNPFGQDSESE